MGKIFVVRPPTTNILPHENYTLYGTLQEKTGITNKELQKNVEKEDINNLAEHFGSWTIFVYKPGFNLSETEITDVQDMANRYNNKMAISTALRTWLKKNPWETNRSLLQITKWIARKERLLLNWQRLVSYIPCCESHLYNYIHLAVHTAPAKKRLLY